MSAVAFVNLSVPLTAEFVLGVFDVADYAAIDYWTTDTRIDRDAPLMRVTVSPDLITAVPHDLDGSSESVTTPGRFTVRAGNLAAAFEAIASGRYRVRADIMESIRTGLLEGDTGEIDAEAADVLIQVAAWGSVVFG